MAEVELDLPTVVAEIVAAGVAASYPKVWAAAVSRRIPAQRIGRYYRVKRADLPQIIAYFRDPSASPAA
jgi:hypothetical protein